MTNRYNPFGRPPGITNSGTIGNVQPPRNASYSAGIRDMNTSGYAGGYSGPGAGAADPTMGLYGGYRGGGSSGGSTYGMSMLPNQQTFGGGGAGAGGGGNVGGPQMPYQPNAPKTQNLIDPLAQAGQGLLDPDSAYSQRLRNEMVGGIGDQTEAMKRAAALQASRAGFGSGAGAELLETQGDIDRAGLQAQGDAAADMTLASPKLGAQLMAPALSAQLGLQGQNLQGYMGQQRIAAQQEAQQMQADIEAARLAQEQLFRELNFMGLGF